jgi:hypothetical protein
MSQYRQSQIVGSGASSQLPKSQAASTAVLNELLDILNKESQELNPNRFVGYDIHDEDFEMDIDAFMSNLNLNDEVPLMESHLTEFGETFNKFCNLFLQENTRFSYEQLFGGEKNLLSNVHYPIFAIFRENINKLIDSLYDSNDQTLSNINTILNNLELVYNFLLNQSKLKYEKLSLFLISTLNSILLVSKYNKKYPTSDLERKSQLVLCKVFNLVEMKLIASYVSESSNDPEVKNVLIRTCKFYAFFIENLKDVKLNMLMWKAMSKLMVTNKLLVDTPETNQLDSQYLARKFFSILHHDLVLDFEYIKAALEKLNDPLSVSDSSASMSQMNAAGSCVSSQMSFKNNILQDTTKVIRLSSILFKLFRSFATIYADYLIEDNGDSESGFYSLMTDVLSFVNYICLYEFKLNVAMKLVEDGDGENRCDENKENSSGNNEEWFRAIKSDIVKELCPTFEALFQFVVSNKSYQEYLFKNGLYNLDSY